jgi:hypothetical protein
MELPILEHALERVSRPQHLDIEIDALGADAAVDQGTRAIIVPARQRQLESGHFTHLPI